MNRQEHLDWAKGRAMEYLEAGDVNNAWASMCSDMNKHEELEGHAGVHIGMMLIMTGNLSTVAEMRKFIEGFN